jgi:bifunctional DNase/RNase
MEVSPPAQCLDRKTHYTLKHFVNSLVFIALVLYRVKMIAEPTVKIKVNPNRQGSMAGMIEVVIDSVRVSLTNQQRIVILKQVSADRYLPIWIGPYEAEAITIALQEVEIARPQTHDLIKNLIHAMNTRLLRIEITAIREDVYFANLVLEAGGEDLRIDCRPSDAVALAVRCHVPILVAKDVMETAAIIPEPEESSSQEHATKPSRKRSTPPEQSTDRLSIFEDFIDHLEVDGSGKSNPPPETPPKPRKPKKV